MPKKDKKLYIEMIVILDELLESKLIDDEKYSKCESIIAEQCGLSEKSFYRKIDLWKIKK